MAANTDWYSSTSSTSIDYKMYNFDRFYARKKPYEDEPEKEKLEPLLFDPKELDI